MKLKMFRKSDFLGAPKWKLALWYFAGTYFVESNIFFSSCFKVFILRLFGAEIGSGCNIKPRVKVKLPWKLKLGNDVWLGEGVWIDNIEVVHIGNDVCVSQEAYLCTGNHDWGRQDFALTAKPIRIESQAWIGARAIIGPGVTVGRGAVLALGGVAVTDLSSMMIYSGNPVQQKKERRID